jgi:hypothetical protein
LCAKHQGGFGRRSPLRANAFTVSTLNSIGFAKLKQVFKQWKNSRRKHNAGFGFASGFHLINAWTAISSSELPRLSFP